MFCTMGMPVFGAENTKMGNTARPGNPKFTAATPATWDCVWFGHYPQKKVEPSNKVYAALNNSSNWDANNDLEINGNQYHREEGRKYTDEEGGWVYYQYGPIKWRVLSVEGNEALLLADKNLDARPYSIAQTKFTWETFALRNWLNGSGKEDFLGKAFTPAEQKAINVKRIVNKDNPVYGTPGGNDTNDRVFFLSIEEATNPSYGFSGDYKRNSRTRKSFNTEYAKFRGADDTNGAGVWLLRSPGYKSSDDTSDGTSVHHDGSVLCDSMRTKEGYGAVRPTLCLNLNSDVWSYAGTVSSDGTVNENAGNAGVKPGNPIVPQDESGTWECIQFGHYPQASDGNGGYKVEPIKWRVLSVKGDEALLLADKNLDCKTYNKTDADTGVTWETSTVRGWLNGYGSSSNGDGEDYTNDNFLKTAFSSVERGEILQKTIKNDNNSEYGTNGGNDTTDKVFFLSIEEAVNPAYGFASDYDKYSKTRRSVNTEYAKSRGDWAEDDENDWQYWLRSPGDYPGDAAIVDSRGYVDRSGTWLTNDYNAVRPALYLNLNSDVWSYAGTVSTASLSRITASKGKTTYNVNEKLKVNDLTVTAFYTNGSSKTVTGYKTNADQIDMATAGTKTLKVTYEEDGVAKTASVQITVTRGNKKETKQTSVSKTSKPKKATLKKVSSAKKGTLKLTWKRDKKANGYQAVVATDKKFKKNKKTVNIKKNKTVTKTFKKLKRKKTYYAKVRAYKKVGTKKVYGAYSKVKKARVK